MGFLQIYVMNETKDSIPFSRPRGWWQIRIQSMEIKKWVEWEIRIVEVDEWYPLRRKVFNQKLGVLR
jgi:hypothetical protein